VPEPFDALRTRGPTCDCLLDTSAVSRLIEDSKRADALAASVRGTPTRLLVSFTVVDELLALASDQQVLRMGERFARLLRGFHGSMVISMSVWDLVQEESWRSLATTPALDWADTQTIAGRLEEASARGDPSLFGLNAARERVAGWKERIESQLSPLRAGWRAAFRAKKLRASAVGSALADYAPEDVPPRMCDAVLSTAGVLGLRGEQVVADIDRYRATRAQAALVRLTMYGDVVPTDLRTKHWYLPALKTNANNLYDCQIASSAAYAAYLVAEDRCLRDKCLALTQSGLLRFRAIGLSELERRGVSA
jgi:hypothetical protein